MGERVITGFDGSDPSRAAVEWAAREASRLELPLEVLQAWPWGPSRPLGTGQAERWGREQLAAQADTIRSRFPGLEVRATHVPDDAVAVLKAASDRAAILVLGSRRLSALRGFLVGSVSQQVLGHATCPVVLVRAPSDLTDGPSSDGSAEQGLVVGLDLAHPCQEVLAFAFEIAARRGVSLTVVHAWGPPAGTEYMHFGAIGGLEDELAEPERQALEEAVMPWLERYPDLPTETALLRGHAGLTLVDAAATAELLVIGARHRRSPVGAHLGPVAHAVIHHVGCPVAVVPHH
ncbi:universal stress protein [Kitasatospora azatica]|uniref:universal stress protein n=1 Tax=Kitasatospora azatica TaxID=58347 RepID=UPI000562C93B|nr:universal stress protein [Kitasatospora azatica]